MARPLAQAVNCAKSLKSPIACAGIVDHENIARDRLRISALKWIAARMAPRKYGNPRKQ